MKAIPFARFHALMAMAAAFMQQGMTRTFALERAGAGAYRSRGKGIGKTTHHYTGTVAQAKRASIKAKSREKHRRACRG